MENKGEGTPVTRVTELLPRMYDGHLFNNEAKSVLGLSLSFIKQSFLKQLLTEGMRETALPLSLIYTGFGKCSNRICR